MILRCIIQFTWTDTYCVLHWRSYWQVRSQTISAGHSARSL